MNKPSLFKIYKSIIAIIIYPLFFLTFLAAIQASQLNFATISKPLFTLVFFLVIISAILWHFRTTTWSLAFKAYLQVRGHAVLSVIISMAFAFLIQLIVLFNAKTPIGWDVGSVVSIAIKPSIGSNYVSINPNNLFLISLYHFLYAWLMPSPASTVSAWLFFQIITVIELDLSVVFLIYAVRLIFNRDVAMITYIIFYFLFLFTPYIQTPYSDIAVLLPTSLALVSIAKLEKSHHIQLKFLWAILTASLAAISFAIKPSALIIIIAWLIERFVSEILVNTEKGKYQRLIILLTVLLSFVGAYHALNTVTEAKTPIKIEKNLALPWQHFAYMGITGNGGYNDTIKSRTINLKNTKKMERYSITGINHRLHELGPIGYFQFLTVKQMNNTSRGDFSWGGDGIALSPFTKTKNSLQSRIRSLYLVGGSHAADLSFYFQIVWIFTLIGIMFTLFKRKKEAWIGILILSMLGGFLYLLLFEGGRSRYLIQFLPVIVPLAAYGWFTLAKMVQIRYKRELRH